MHPSVSGTPLINLDAQQEETGTLLREPLQQVVGEGSHHEAIARVLPHEHQISVMRTPDQFHKERLPTSAPEGRLERPFEEKKRRSLGRIRGKDRNANPSSQEIWDLPDSENSSQSLPQLLNDSNAGPPHNSKFGPHLFSQVNGVSQHERAESIVHVGDPLRGWPRNQVNPAQKGGSAKNQSGLGQSMASIKSQLPTKSSVQNLSQNTLSAPSTDDVGPVHGTDKNLVQPLVSTDLAFTPINGAGGKHRHPNEHVEGSPLDIAGVVERQLSMHPSSSHIIDHASESKEPDHLLGAAITDDTKSNRPDKEGDRTSNPSQNNSEHTNVVERMPASFTSVNGHLKGGLGDNNVKPRKRKKENRESTIEKKRQKQSEPVKPLNSGHHSKTVALEEFKFENKLVPKQAADKSDSRKSKKQRRSSPIQGSQPERKALETQEASRAVSSPLVEAENTTTTKYQWVLDSSQSIATSGTPSKNGTPRACIECNKRKRKCDRGTPCSACTKRNQACEYPGPAKAVHRQPGPVSDSELLGEKSRLSDSELLGEKKVASKRNTSEEIEKVKSSGMVINEEKRRKSEEKAQKGAKRVETAVASVKEVTRKLRKSESRDQSSPQVKPGMKGKVSNRSERRSSQITRDPDSFKGENRHITYLDPQTPLPKSVLRSSPAMSSPQSKRSVSFVDEPKANGPSNFSNLISSAPYGKDLPDSTNEDVGSKKMLGEAASKQCDSSGNDLKSSVQKMPSRARSKNKGKARLVDPPQRSNVPKEVIQTSGSMASSSEDESEPPAVDGAAGPSKGRTFSGPKTKQSHPSNAKTDRGRTSSIAHRVALPSKEEKPKLVSAQAPSIIRKDEVESGSRSKSLSRSPAKEIMSDTSRSTSGSEEESVNDDDNSEDDDDKNEGKGSSQVPKSRTTIDEQVSSKGDSKIEKIENLSKPPSNDSSSLGSDSEDDSTDESEDDQLVKRAAQASVTKTGKKRDDSPSRSNNSEHSSRSTASSPAQESEENDEDEEALIKQEELPNESKSSAASNEPHTASTSIKGLSQNETEQPVQTTSVPVRNNEINPSRTTIKTTESSGILHSSDSEDSSDSTGDGPNQQLQREAQRSVEPPQPRSKIIPTTTSKTHEVTKPVQNGLRSAAKVKDTSSNVARPANSQFPTLTNLVSNPNGSTQQRKKISSVGTFSKRDAKEPASNPLIDLETSGSSYRSSESDEEDDDASIIVTNSRPTQLVPKRTTSGMKDLLKRMLLIAFARNKANECT